MRDQNGGVAGPRKDAPKIPQERRWYVRVDDHVDGPHPESRVKEWLKDGRLPQDVLLSADGRTWRRVRIRRAASAP